MEGGREGERREIEREKRKEKEFNSFLRASIEGRKEEHARKKKKRREKER